tara:strand:- start:200 stop:598 length:399 start_codon:yes stop_codon:yes gene_type:complete
VENSGYESSLLVAGIVLLVFVSCIVDLIRKGKEKVRKKEFESRMSKRRQILTVLKNQPKTRPSPLPKPAYASQPKPAPEPQYTTSNEITQEAITALVKMGHTKTEAKKIVSEFCGNSTFNSSEELLQAAFSK